MKTLVIGAHPDDIETMLSGAISNNTVALVATDGEASTVNYRSDPNFVHSGKRQQESAEGLRRSGVPPEGQHFLSLPDGKLSDSTYYEQLVQSLQELLLAEPISEIYTLGAQGYDGHPDHIATHKALLEAVKRTNCNATIYGLNANHSGSRVIPVHTHRKLYAMSAHGSHFLIHDSEQLPFTKSTPVSGYSIDTDFWEYFTPYHRLILEQETYDRISAA